MYISAKEDRADVILTDRCSVASGLTPEVSHLPASSLPPGISAVFSA